MPDRRAGKGIPHVRSEKKGEGSSRAIETRMEHGARSGVTRRLAARLSQIIRTSSVLVERHLGARDGN